MCAFSVSPFVGPACVRNLRSLGTVQRLGSIVAWFFSRFVRTLCVQLVGYVRMYVRIREEDRAVFNGEPLSRGWTNVTLWSGHNRASGIEVAIVPGGQLLHPRPRVHVQRFLQKSGTKRWSFSLTSSLHGSLNTRLVTVIGMVSKMGTRSFEFTGIKRRISRLILTRMLQEVGYKTYDRSKFYPSIT